MNVIARISAALGLGLTIVPSFLVVSQSIAWQTHANLMLAGMVLWFLGASFVRKDSQDS